MAYGPHGRVWRPAATAVLAVSVADMKSHFRVTNSFEDDVIASMSRAAQGLVEQKTQRFLIQRQAVLYLPGLPTGFEAVELPGGDVSAVSSVVADGLAITGCTVWGDAPARLIPADEWPVVTGEGYPVAITYTAGYTTLPEDLGFAIKLIAAELYERRSNADDGGLRTVPVSAEMLMEPYRIRPAP